MELRSRNAVPDGSVIIVPDAERLFWDDGPVSRNGVDGRT
jgi:hypothetical protein